LIENNISTYSQSVNKINTSKINCIDDGKTCEQFWAIDITPTQLRKCNIDGLYIFNFNITCFPPNDEYSYPGCELDNNNNSGSIEFILQSENYCPQLIETVDLTGVILLFGNSERTLTKSNFVYFQTLYGVVNSKSIKSTITNSIITDFEIINENKSIILFSDGYDTIYGNTTNFKISDSNRDNFNFDILPSIFQIELDKKRRISCLITVDVDFFNTVEKRNVDNKRLINSQYQASETYLFEFNINDMTASSSNSNCKLHIILIILYLVLI
jgi:hypothetical protein